jgi:transcriptional regulator with XRE-family HTH domain
MPAMKTKQEIALAENLKRLMAEKRLTLTAVAKEVGMNKSTLHNYCNGVMPRNIVKIKELAEFLDVSLSDLLFDQTSHREQKTTNSTDDRKEEFFKGTFEIIVRRVNDA